MMQLVFFVLCVSINTAGAADLQGRVFFTPQQRAQLEAARAQKERQQPVEIESSAPPAPPVPGTITYGGIVRRNDGKSTVWLNDKPISDRKTAASAGIAGVRADGAITVKPPLAERSVALKVGQSLEITSGAIEEPYARRLTRSVPAAKAAIVSPAGSVPEKAPLRRSARDDAADEPGSSTVSRARDGPR